MAVMRTVGTSHRLPARATVRDDGDEYVIELDVSDFLVSELAVDVVGLRVTVHGDQVQEPGEDNVALRLHERLEESFRLPDDADADLMKVFHAHGALEIHVPHTTLESRRVPIEHRSPFVGNPDAGPC
jgi:HSP20 family molecular chaperone IbpA